MKNVYVNFNGVLANFHNIEWSRMEVEHGVNIDFLTEFEELEFKNNIDTVRKATQKYNVYIISRVASDEVKNKMLTWIENKIPEISKDNVLIFVNVSRKCYATNENDILIDDNNRYVKQWNKYGGKGILIDKGENIDKYLE